MGGGSASHIARWDGSAWSALGSGITGAVLVFALFSHDDGAGPALYVGGDFSTAGGLAVDNLARWTGCASSSSNIPVLAGWGAALLAMLFLAGGAVLLRRRRLAAARR